MYEEDDMFSSDEIKQIFNAHRLYQFRQRLDASSSLADYISLLEEIDLALPVKDTAPDFPGLSVLPTAFDPPSEWPDLLSSYPFDSATIDRLLRAGLVPLDRESPAFGVTGDPFPETVQGRYLLLDPDYLAVLLPYEGGGLGNLMLARITLQRYLPYYPILGREKSAIFSLGAIRGHLGYHGALRGNYFEPIDVTVSSRSELDDLVARLRDNLSGRPDFQLWFRGQILEHLTADLTAQASQGICPWRSLRDPSLVPSLCRRLLDRWGSWREYAAFLIEFYWYTTFLERDLGMPAFDRRPLGEKPGERLTPEFGGGDKWTVEDLRKGEAHDYQQTYRGLQKLFFFQHYGLASSVLDITHDLDVALFFANNRADDGRYIPVGPDPARVLYIMILHKGVDQFLDSGAISEHYGLLRPLRQKCGLIAGASMVNRNAYARFVSVRVHLDGNIEHGELTPSYLFPGPGEDTFLERLLAFQGKREIDRIQPFVLSTG
jgi:hypothetical protein